MACLAAAFLFLCGCNRGSAEGSTSPALDVSPKFAYSIPVPRAVPQGIALYSGRIYLSYNNVNMIDVFDQQGVMVDSFIPFPGPEANPVSMTADGTGKIYIADSLNRIVLVFNGGKFLYPFPQKKVAAQEESFIHIPYALATRDRLVFVVDIGDNTVKVFLDNGEPLMVIGESADHKQITQPRAIALCSDGRSLISDIDLKTVAVHDCSGKFAHYFGRTKWSEMTLPISLQIDGLGRVHVADGLKHRIAVYDNYGRPLFEYGEFGEKPWQMAFPRGIAVDSETRKIFICDSGNSQVDVWQY